MNNVITSLSKTKLPEFGIEAFLFPLFGEETNKIIKKIRTLRSKEYSQPLSIFDFDDTLYSRAKTLELDGLANNRGKDGNLWLLAYYGGLIESTDHGVISDETKQLVINMSLEEKQKAIKKFVEEFYSNEGDGDKKLGLVQNIYDLINKTSSKATLILTAGDKILQEEKLDKTGLNTVPYSIVEKSSQKIKQTIVSIIERGEIPETVEIYEDRPEYFFKYGQVLADVFGNIFTIHGVKIDPDSNKAEPVRTVSFQSRDTQNYS